MVRTLPEYGTNRILIAYSGYYYNQTFINLKIDAEEGEGITLAKKYGVRSYPTYAFIDPATEEIVHHSSSRQTPEQFIQTGKDATVPTKRSFYLQDQYTKGNRERAFLIDYINYHYSVYARKNVQAAFDELIKGGAKLTDPDVWEVYVNTINRHEPVPKASIRQIMQISVSVSVKKKC